MTEVVEIPVFAKNQQFDILLSGKYYRMRLVYREFCGWVVDIMSQSDEIILAGIPLVSGVDILEPYRYMGFNGGIVFYCNDLNREKVKDELGRSNRLYFVHTDSLR